MKNYKEFMKNNKRHNVFTEEANKIALYSNDDKRIQSTDSIETHAYEKKSKT